MRLTICSTHVIKQQKLEEAGRRASDPLFKLAVVAVVKNPFAGTFTQDLDPMIQASVELGVEIGAMLVNAIAPRSIQSFGKGGIVGYGGEQEHANALLTSAFANPIRTAIGGAEAWISSMTKIGGPATSIDIPMNHKDEIYVRSHYDGMSLMLADAPLPDEIAVIFCVASAGRLNARVGGTTHEEVQQRINRGAA